ITKYYETKGGWNEKETEPKQNCTNTAGVAGCALTCNLYAAQALGIAQGAFEAALAYAHQRQQFGQRISSFQAIQHLLADMATQIEAARGLVYHSARLIDAGEKDVSMISSMAKLFASDTAMKVTTDAIQIFGGYGYMKEYPVEKMFRDAKITQIYEGTNQIQRNVIALELIKGLKKGTDL
ncbi:MAG TPA: acyl-CoA dehydrogenase family protein, partial [bacterium]|nr:acyl-CoA dehydrogenase family protein [bacterium]